MNIPWKKAKSWNDSVSFFTKRGRIFNNVHNSEIMTSNFIFHTACTHIFNPFLRMMITGGGKSDMEWACLQLTKVAFLITDCGRNKFGFAEPN
mmetsp:Transcript_40187/g.40822  ORF Transcript_40187/g.40822 Transcript_40187/m.40822 type:complete len:93 (-) Transcript_40187:28-306(-)